MRNNRHGLPILETAVMRKTTSGVMRDEPNRLELYYDRLTQIHQIASRQARDKAKAALDAAFILEGGKLL